MLLHLILPFLSVTENELSYLTLLARTDVGQAVSQPESIEYIKHTSCAAPVQKRECARARFVTYECT